MIPLRSWLASKKAEWWARREAALRAEFAAQETHLKAEQSQTLQELRQAFATAQETLQRDQRDLADLEQRLQDRKVEVARVHEELQQQLRLIEAKASPANIWIEAFSLGLSKYCDIILPLLKETLGKSYTQIQEEVTNQVLHGLEPVIRQRLETAQLIQLRPQNDLLAKRAEFERKRGVTTDPTERTKYENYLTALGWLLDGH